MASAKSGLAAIIHSALPRAALYQQGLVPGSFLFARILRYHFRTSELHPSARAFAREYRQKAREAVPDQRTFAFKWVTVLCAAGPLRFLRQGAEGTRQFLLFARLEVNREQLPRRAWHLQDNPPEVPMQSTSMSFRFGLESHVPVLRHPHQPQGHGGEGAGSPVGLARGHSVWKDGRRRDASAAVVLPTLPAGQCPGSPELIRGLSPYPAGPRLPKIAP